METTSVCKQMPKMWIGPICLSDPTSLKQPWAYEEMAGAGVIDPRCIRSLATICDNLVKSAGISFSAAVGHAGRQASARICGNPRVTPSDLLKGHIEQTALRCKPYPFVVVAQDTTAMDYSTHKATTGLGPVNNSPDSLGFFLHTSLALTPEGLPLGIVDIQTWVRDNEEYGKSENRRNLETTQKESHKWIDALRGVEAALGSGQQVLIVSDRESDFFGYFSAPRGEHTELLVRACQHRSVETLGEDGCVEKGEIFAVAKDAPVVARMVVKIPRKKGQPEREALLEIRMTRLRMLPPRHRRADIPSTPVEVSVVQAKECTPPEGVEPVHWVLLTTVEIANGEAACQIVRYYALRWTIERLHLVLKDGLRVERLQIDDGHPLRNTVALYCVAAWRIMALTHTARTDPERPATDLLDSDEIALLSQVAKRPVLTVGEAVVEIAKLGGYRPYRSSGPPGVKSLWVGLRRLGSMVEGRRLTLAQLDLNRQSIPVSIFGRRNYEAR